MKCIICNQNFPTHFYFVFHNPNLPCINCKKNNRISDDALISLGIKKEYDKFSTKSKISKNDKTDFKLKKNISLLIMFFFTILLISLTWLPFYIWMDYLREYREYYIFFNLIMIYIFGVIMKPVEKYKTHYNSFNTIFELANHNLNFTQYVNEYQQSTFSHDNIIKFVKHLKSKFIITPVQKKNRVILVFGSGMHLFFPFFKPELSNYNYAELYFDGKINIEINDKTSQNYETDLNSGLSNVIKMMYIAFINNDDNLFINIVEERKDLIIDSL